MTLLKTIGWFKFLNIKMDKIITNNCIPSMDIVVMTITLMKLIFRANKMIQVKIYIY
jgi:hypothetical protein